MLVKRNQLATFNSVAGSHFLTHLSLGGGILFFHLQHDNGIPIKKKRLGYSDENKLKYFISASVLNMLFHEKLS